MPLPGTRVIPTGWEEHHRPVAEGQMTGQCVITRPPAAGDGAFNDMLGRTLYPDPTTLYTGPARAQASNRISKDQQVGDAEVTIHRYQVAVPIGTSPPDLRINDTVTFTACTDPWLVDRPLRIVDIPAGTLMWQRDLVCEEVTPTSR